MKRIMFGLLVFVFLAGCTQTAVEDEVVVEEQPETAEEAQTEQVSLANPASTYCERKGYDVEIREEVDGSAGYCIFPDGNECEEWDFYLNKTCGRKYH